MEKVHATEFLGKTGLGLTVLHCNASIQQTSYCNRLQSLPLLILIGPSSHAVVYNSVAKCFVFTRYVSVAQSINCWGIPRLRIKG